MEALRNLWAGSAPYRGWLLLVVGVLLLVAAAVGLAWWLRRRRRGASSLGAPPPMSRHRLRNIHRSFLAALPWLQRAAVKDLPCAVVLGPAGSGKSKLIDLDVDWQRQSRQFLPSHTSDSLLQLYLGPDSVVQELSAPLLEDDTPQARGALRRLWKDSLGQGQHALAVLVLDVRWLAETPPDEVRRAAQLLRGKLNLLAEVRRGPVETRLCLTHMDALEGFEDFSRLLHAHRVPLSFALPPRGEEGQVASLLQAQEQYLALGLTSLPVESFERLERFYSQGHRPFEALARFTTALLEGGTLAFVPRLSRVYLSSPSTRAAGVLSVPGEVHDAQALRGRYLKAHLKRAAMLAVAGSLPMLAAYAHFSWRLSQAQERVGRFESTVQRMRDQGQAVSGSVAQEQVLAAGQAMDLMWRATSYWPLLPYSFSEAREDLRKRLTRGIREAHLRPALERCHQQPDACRPEQVVFLLATLHASRVEPLGQFVLSSLRNRRAWSFVDLQEAASTAEPSALESGRSWLTAINLVESLVGDYVVISDRPWQAPTTPEADWARWPFREAFTLEGQLAPWQAHLRRLHDFLRDQAVEPWELGRLNAELDAMREERARLRAWLDDSATFATLPRALDLLQASEARVDTSHFKGLSSTLQAVEWMNKNREALAGVLQMEEEMDQGLKAAQRMSVAELLVRDGVWLPGASTRGPFRVSVTQGPLEFHPKDSARQLHQAILRYYERTGRLPFGSARDEEAGSRLSATSVSEDRLTFDTRIRPLVDEFTQRLKNADLPVEEASQRQEHVRRQVDQFALRYRQRLFQRVHGYRFDAPTPALLSEALARLTQPSSELVDMLRDVSRGASLEPLEGPYYESLRNAVAPFKPIVQVMKPDESGNQALLNPYRALVAQLTDELHAVSRGAARSVDVAASGKEGGGAARLPEMLTPLGRIAFSMMLEEEGSYLRKVDAWLDQQGLIGELREPFRQPFLAVRELGQQEIERTLRQQWEGTWGRLLRPLLSRYPFSPDAAQEVEPGDLEILRRKDGVFWAFVDRVVTPVCEERGTEWVLRGALRERLSLPEDLLPTLGRLSRLAQVLWDAEGRPRPLLLKVMPLPLPAAPAPGSFFTLGSLKCGRTAAFAYNQSPSWQEFPLDWWDQQTASLVLELRSPEQQAIQYSALQKNRSVWSCFRLLEESQSTGDQRRLWRLQGRTAEKTAHVMEVRFGLKGEPWTPFREVSP
ncbi:hypothetical protein HPC49_12390 [Pyxidicoccus fallax]|uniref:Type VI secretion system IcmF C-terminal domain-containing protein n=1 Tax=Pyxidicoccus fallax TaxID=394095 RepID=A0A848LLJ3_9BACT|nr:type VI secretion IcmF C-terminal domain-containing protein [Pyxidicoccus fallax]NMO18628.1 hypothetical protein [Pyxidicoccus fallax]NPC79033.1 hypothetical protein [Pyxidicoccus fallax]